MSPVVWHYSDLPASPLLRRLRGLSGHDQRDREYRLSREWRPGSFLGRVHLSRLAQHVISMLRAIRSRSEGSGRQFRRLEALARARKVELMPPLTRTAGAVGWRLHPGGWDEATRAHRCGRRSGGVAGDAQLAEIHQRAWRAVEFSHSSEPQQTLSSAKNFAPACICERAAGTARPFAGRHISPQGDFISLRRGDFLFDLDRSDIE